MTDRRVLITGSAAYTCCGLGTQPFVSQVRHDASGAGDAGATGPRRYAPADLTVLPRNLRPPHDQAVRLLAALHGDLGDYLDDLSEDDGDRVGVWLGSAYGHMEAYFDYYETGTVRGHQFVNPALFPYTGPTSSVTEVSRAFSLHGGCTAVNSGMVAGLAAIGAGASAVGQGDEDAALVGGLDEVSKYTEVLLRSMVHRAGEVRSNGAVWAGDGIGMLLLQSEGAAGVAGRRPLAEVGAVNTIGNLPLTSSDAVARAADVIRATLARSGMKPDDIVAVLTSSGGDPACTGLEHEILGHVLRSVSTEAPRVSIKHTVGECFAASGPLQCIAGIDWLPTDREGKGVLVVSTGFDGTFGVLVLKSPGNGTLAGR